MSKIIAKKRSAGFTLVELLIVIGITTILAGVSAVVYGNLQVSTQLNETSYALVQNLRLAREQSIAGLDNVTHGIKFDSNNYTLYQGASYLTRQSAYDRVFPIASAIVLTPDLSLPGQEIIFSRGNGMPSATGTVTLSHVVSGTRAVVINDLGIVREQ